MDKGDHQKKKSYRTPKLITIDLVAENALLTGGACKVSGGGASVPPNFGSCHISSCLSPV
jgi:hypothetical protein